MSNLPNLTDQISRLRDRKVGSTIVSGNRPTPSETTVKVKERKFAPDSFMLFVYVLLTIAFVAQLSLIVWLDII